MPVSPLDYRYGRDPIKLVWSQDGRHSRQLEVERALIWAHNQLGRVSDEHYATIAAISNPQSVTAERVDEIERETRHDIMALTKAMAEAAGEAGWCIHLGATSNDIVDTAVGLQIKDSVEKIKFEYFFLDHNKENLNIINNHFNFFKNFCFEYLYNDKSIQVVISKCN